jgi:L-threonylcarbamoyladenylate synthase
MDDLDLVDAVTMLRRGLVVAAATETFFGLLADARQPAAIDRVLALKGRDEKKGIALLLPSREAWESLVTNVPPLAALLANRFWPGPLTIALAARSDIDPRLTVDATVAVRWGGDSAAARLTRMFGAPLTATSANRVGEPPCTSHDQVVRAFAAAQGAEQLITIPGHAPGGAPSTLVAVDDNRVRIVREGQVSANDLATVVPRAALG